MFTKNHRASWEGFALCFFCSPVSSSECKSLLTGLPVSGSSTAFCRPAPGCQCWANITPRLERSRAVDDINWSQPISIEIRWQDFAQSFTGEDLSDHFTPLQGAKTLVVVGSPSIDNLSACCSWVKWFKIPVENTKHNLLHSSFLYWIRECICLFLSCPCSYLFRLLLMRTWLTPTLKSRRLVNQWLNNGRMAVCTGCRLCVCMAVSMFLWGSADLYHFPFNFSSQPTDGQALMLDVSALGCPYPLVRISRSNLVLVNTIQ